MCRMVGWVSDRPVSLREVLGEVGLKQLIDLSRYHGHGWGMAHRDPQTGVLGAVRSTKAAREDASFATAADIRSTAALVHLRWATPGFGLEITDFHPFLADDWAMVHNGAISPAGAVKGLMRPDSHRRPGGTTDSEHLFLAVLDELDQMADATVSTTASIARAMEIVSDRGVDAGLSASSLNSLYLGPHGIYAVNWADVTKVPAYMAEAAKDDPSSPPYYDLLQRHDDSQGGLDVIASSGFVSDPVAWQRIPEMSVFGVEQPGSTATCAISPTRALCPTRH
jgi:predicted glutamine amidotransferase